MAVFVEEKRAQHISSTDTNNIDCMMVTFTCRFTFVDADI